ncbi:WD40-repeat-containing domain protein [Zychaea mexicana]|uniref:WD40-repeat-containing domain protein n=1 Tax=Zychaea mexicana TaxID=64656 RepID=UPI0022FEC4AB|nr:WD40-repeat-containing domain protein [Zychaea mexicana]KAI9492674.1 WD40-repeat-containing domain protein [Zychaea mexicana]
MRAKTLEINWHDGQAIYSVDFSSDGTRMASAGADTSVRLWSMKRRPEVKLDNSNKKSFEKKIESFPVHIDFLSELKRHAAPVNVVRFSPSGEYLASAGDDSCVILWKKALTQESAFGREYAEFEKETWSVVQLFHGHSKEIYDLAWSPCSQFFITASIDNTARIWSISTRSAIHVLTDHTHYVQGVTWDPMGQYVATQSSDRSVAIYKYRKEGPNRLKLSGCSKRHHRMNKPKPAAAMNEDVAPTTTTITAAPTASSTATTVPSFRMYHDENLVTFFRRLSFSPDGAFLVTPAGLCKSLDTAIATTTTNNNNTTTTSDSAITTTNITTTATTTNGNSNEEEGDDLANCAYLYPRNTLLKHPMAYTSNHNKPSIAIRWCSDTYELRSSAKRSMFGLPYRLIYAVASQDAVYIYDTQQAIPLCVISGMHFAPITDIAWSHDGSILVFSSADGYCSAVVFDENELGKANARKPTMDIAAATTATTTTSTMTAGGPSEEHDIEMMDITSPPEKQPRPVNILTSLIKPAEKRSMQVTSNTQKKRRIAPTLISTITTSSSSTTTATASSSSSSQSSSLPSSSLSSQSIS